MKLRVVPGKVVVKKHEAKLKGKIHLPPSRTKLYEIGEIVEVGRLMGFGYRNEEKTAEEYKPGDLVLFSLPLPVAGAVTHEVKGTLHAFLNVLDIIGRLDSDVIELAKFHIAGRNVLLEPTVRKASSIIIVPGTAEEANKENTHYSVVQMGKDVTIDVLKGQEVFPNKGRVNFLNIENMDLVFLDQQFIDGALVPE